jgi:hypothetical protein
MAHDVMTDQAGVRFALGNGVLFVLAGVIVAGRLPAPYGVGLFLVVTAALAVGMDGVYAVALGLSGWAFATGFAVHSLGVLTFAPSDLLRMMIFVGAAAAGSPVRTRARARRVSGCAAE